MAAVLGIKEVVTTFVTRIKRATRSSEAGKWNRAGVLLESDGGITQEGFAESRGTHSKLWRRDKLWVCLVGKLFNLRECEF